MSSKRMVLKVERESDIGVKGIIFDMDGTLCLPQPWMFKLMREVLGITNKPVDILTHISSLPELDQVKAKQDIEDVEAKAMLEMEPQPGLVELFEFMSLNDVKRTICTRNLITPVNHLISNYLPNIELNEPIITRSFLPPKPAPDPLLHIIESWGLKPEEVIMVGDSVDDMTSGLRAGCGLILIRHENNEYLIDSMKEIDYVIETLDEIVNLLQNGIVLKNRS